MNSISPLTPLPVAEGEAALTSPIPLRRRVKIRAKPALRLAAVYSILGALFYFALRNAPFVEIWNAVKQLKLWQIAVLVIINVSIYMLVTLRWWIIIRAELKSIAYLPLVLVRVAVFGVSYFTLGPQVGGEPLQVLYLQRKYGMTYTRATSTVIMDKLLEFLANFFLLVFGLMAVLQAGILSTNGSKPLMSLIPLAALLAWTPIHITLMIRGVYPAGAALRAAFSRFGTPKWVRFIIASERMAGMFCQRYPRALLMAVGVSLAAGAGMVSEYALITSFLGINLHGWQTFAAWTTSWLAFLVPLPGGLGALEASQVFTLGAFEISAALAIGVTLLIRGRDLLIGGFGLLLASRGVK
ncbi:MAG TPA: lysylphosphatidylglycerol synthase transmembrane domain-containing protein [Anaerolineales bacterium]